MFRFGARWRFIKELELNLKNEHETVKVDLKHELETVKAELKNDIEKVRAELETVKTELKRDIHEMEHKLTIKLGAIVVIGITVLSVLDKLL